MSQPTKKKRKVGDGRQQGTGPEGAGQVVGQPSDAVRDQQLDQDQSLYKRILKLPAELQIIVFEMAGDAIGTHRGTRQLWKLNCATNQISDEPDKIRYVVPVYDNGMSWIFSVKINEVWYLFQQFMQVIRNKVIFMFHSPNAVTEFFRQLKLFYKNVNFIPAIRIAIPLFSTREISQEQGAELSEFEPLEVAHGTPQKAFEHVASWMDVVQNIPPKVEVEVTMNRPWADYRNLRGLSEQMRRGGRIVHVRINKPAFTIKFPDPDLHIGLTIAALKGVTMAKQSNFSELEARFWVDHGCRGFRA